MFYSRSFKNNPQIPAGVLSTIVITRNVISAEAAKIRIREQFVSLFSNASPVQCNLVPTADLNPTTLTSPPTVDITELYNGILIDTANLAISQGIIVYGDLDISAHSAALRILPVFQRNLPHSREDAAANFAATLHLADLYLAIACACGNELAWKVFGAHFRKYLDKLCLWVHGAARGYELAEDVFADLYLPDSSGQSRIASYDGRSTMSTWLRVIVGNRSLNEQLRKCNSDMRLSAVHEVVDRKAHLEIETNIYARRYEQILLASLQNAAHEQLNENERLILLLRYDQNLRLGEIADLLGIHQSTVTRKMDRAMRRFRDHVLAIMRREGLSDMEVRDCVNLLSRDDAFSFSIIHLIKAEQRAPIRIPA